MVWSVLTIRGVKYASVRNTSRMNASIIRRSIWFVIFHLPFRLYAGLSLATWTVRRGCIVGLVLKLVGVFLVARTVFVRAGLIAHYIFASLTTKICAASSTLFAVIYCKRFSVHVLSLAFFWLSSARHACHSDGRSGSLLSYLATGTRPPSASSVVPATYPPA